MGMSAKQLLDLMEKHLDAAQAEERKAPPFSTAFYVAREKALQLITAIDTADKARSTLPSQKAIHRCRIFQVFRKKILDQGKILPLYVRVYAGGTYSHPRGETLEYWQHVAAQEGARLTIHAGENLARKAALSDTIIRRFVKR